jgi:hypothetical protein
MYSLAAPTTAAVERHGMALAAVQPCSGARGCGCGQADGCFLVVIRVDYNLSGHPVNKTRFASAVSEGVTMVSLFVVSTTWLINADQGTKE